MAEKVAIITGSNKGLGFAIVKALCQKWGSSGIVYLTARDEEKGLDAVKKLKDMGLNPHFHVLDVTDRSSVEKLSEFIREKHGGFDVLVNNAGVMNLQKNYPTYEEAKENIDTNYKSVITVEKYLYPLLRDGGRVVNISSACGHLSNLKNQKWIKILQSPDLTTDDVNLIVQQYLESLKNGTFNKDDFADKGKHAEHRISKVALTALTKVQQKKYNNISINAVHPGHVKTDMAAGGGDITADEAAKKILYLISDASPHLKGVFMWDNGKIIDWLDADSDFYFSCS